MSGTNPVAPYTKLDNTTFSFSAYKAGIDANSVAALRVVAKFAPSAQASPNMTITLAAGNIFDGTTLTEIAAQNTGTITAPTTHPRIDRVVIDNTTGTLSVVTGTEAVSPTPPAIPTGKSPVAQIELATSTTSITNAIITDERDFTALNIGGFGVQSAISSASTCDIGTLPSHNAKITGSTTITSLGSSANLQDPVYLVEFSGSLTLTHNATNLILPGAVNIKTAAGDTATAEYLGSGHWRVRDYQRANGQAVSITGAEATLASATTTDLGSTGSNAVLISGATTITGFGSSASVANPLYLVRFSGALTLTYDATAMILPGVANITTATGDSLVALYLGSGNWKVLQYTVAASGPGAAQLFLQIDEQQPSGTSGGNLSNGARRTRNLNTIVTDEIGTSLSSNQFTLPAGNYYADCWGAGYTIAHHKVFLVNITDSSDILTGSSAMSGSGDNTQTNSTASGKFTLSGTKTLSLQHQSTSSSSQGMGTASGLGTEIYSGVKIWKLP